MTFTPQDRAQLRAWHIALDAPPEPMVSGERWAALRDDCDRLTADLAAERDKRRLAELGMSMLTEQINDHGIVRERNAWRFAALFILAVGFGYLLLHLACHL